MIRTTVPLPAEMSRLVKLPTMLGSRDSPSPRHYMKKKKKDRTTPLEGHTREPRPTTRLLQVQITMNQQLGQAVR